MKINFNNEDKRANKIRHQRGAALITVLMISTLLMATGGTLILVTSLSTRTAVDATAEMQAYYSAEAGLQDTLNVLRGNVAPNASMPAGSKIDFRKAVTPADSNLPNDRRTRPRLSGWLNYNYTPSAEGSADRIGMTANYNPINGLAYSVEVSDPDNTSVAAGEPARLLLRVTGYGPKGATKEMELVVKRTSFDYAPPAMLLMVGGLNPVTFSTGESAAKEYSGHDNAGGPPLPTFGATSDGDKNIEIVAANKNTVRDPIAATVGTSSLPTYLQSADQARAFLYDPITGQKGNAMSQGRYFTTFSGYSGTATTPAFTFVDGDCTLDGGSGLLIVTGKLTMSGNPSFSGLILVLGDGNVERDGSGNGTVLGAMVVARFDKNGTGPFLAPTFLTNGGGNSTMQYDSNALKQALNASGPRVQGIHEF